MNREDIIRMARETGVEWLMHNQFYKDHLQHFAALVAAAERERVMQVAQSIKADLEARFETVYMEGAMAGAATEREACAKVCDALHYEVDAYGAQCAAAIRARGKA